MTAPSPTRTARATMPRMRNGLRLRGGPAAGSAVPVGGTAWGLDCLTALSMTSHLQMDFGLVALLGAAVDLEEEEQGKNDEEADAGEEEHLLERKHQRLSREDAGERRGRRLRRGLWIEAARGEALRDLAHPPHRLRRVRRHVRRESGLGDGGIAREQRGEDGEPYRAADLAEERVEPGRIGEPGARDPRERDGGQGHEEAGEADALPEQGVDDLRRAGRER